METNYGENYKYSCNVSIHLWQTLKSIKVSLIKNTERIKFRLLNFRIRTYFYLINILFTNVTTFH